MGSRRWFGVAGSLHGSGRGDQEAQDFTLAQLRPVRKSLSGTVGRRCANPRGGDLEEVSRGCRGPVAPAPHGLGDDRMTGWVGSLLHPCCGVEMGDRGPGLLDAGHGPACRREVAQVEGHAWGVAGSAGWPPA